VSLYEILASPAMLTAASYLVALGAKAERSSGVLTGGWSELASLQADLQGKRYRPGRIVRILKGQAGRPQRILQIRDRIVHTSLLLVLEPVLSDACFHQAGDSETVRALEALRLTAGRGSGDLDAFDLEEGGRHGGVVYLEFLRVVACRVHDDALLGLIKLFLKAPVMEVRFASEHERFSTERGGMWLKECDEEPGSSG